jgi:hypothetical protein
MDMIRVVPSQTTMTITMDDGWNREIMAMIMTCPPPWDILYRDTTMPWQSLMENIVMDLKQRTICAITIVK